MLQDRIIDIPAYYGMMAFRHAFYWAREGLFMYPDGHERMDDFVRLAGFPS